MNIQQAAATATALPGLLFRDDSGDGEGGDFLAMLQQRIDGDSEDPAQGQDPPQAAAALLVTPLPLSQLPVPVLPVMAQPGFALPDPALEASALETSAFETSALPAPVPLLSGSSTATPDAAPDILVVPGSADMSLSTAAPGLTLPAAGLLAAPADTARSPFGQGLEYLLGMAHAVDQARAAHAMPAAETVTLQTGENADLPPDAFQSLLPSLQQDKPLQHSAASIAPAGTVLPGMDAAPQPSAATLPAPQTHQPPPALAPAAAPRTPDSAAALFQLPANPMGSEAWLQELGTRVDWLQHMKIQRAELSLHPAELGVLDISIRTNDDDTTTVFFTTQNANARELIEASLPRLRELLASQGLQLEHGAVAQQDSNGHPRNTAGPAQDTTQSSPDAEPIQADVLRRGSMLLPSGRISHYV